MSTYGGVGGGGAAPISVETRVDGSPDELRAQARWLRRTLAGGLDDAADRQTAARRAAQRGWTGAAAAGHDGVSADAVRATDDHAARVRRTAGVVDDLADGVARVRRAMADVRDRAREGGLTVTGTTITVPPPVGAADLPLMGSFLLVEQRRALLGELAEVVTRTRAEHREWLDAHLASATEDASERGDVDRLLARVPARHGPGPGGPAGPAGPAVPVPEPWGGALAGSDAPGGAGGAPASGPGPGRGAVAGRVAGPGVLIGVLAAAPWADGDRPTVRGRIVLRAVVEPHPSDRPPGSEVADYSQRTPPGS